MRVSRFLCLGRPSRMACRGAAPPTKTRGRKRKPLPPPLQTLGNRQADQCPGGAGLPVAMARNRILIAIPLVLGGRSARTGGRAADVGRTIFLQNLLGISKKSLTRIGNFPSKVGALHDRTGKPSKKRYCNRNQRARHAPPAAFPTPALLSLLFFLFYQKEQDIKRGTAAGRAERNRLGS